LKQILETVKQMLTIVLNAPYMSRFKWVMMITSWSEIALRYNIAATKPKSKGMVIWYKYVHVLGRLTLTKHVSLKHEFTLD